MGPGDASGGATLVVTTMPLSVSALADLGEMLGDGYVVVDIKHAPATANVVLTPVVSGQLLGILRAQFPDARILFTELHDEERGISFEGPLSRIAAHGPDGYFVAHELDALAPIVQSEARLQLAGSTRPTPPRTAALTTAREPSTSVAADDGGPALAEDPASVVWVDRDLCDPLPPGRWLDLDRIDDLVTEVTGSAEPRADLLWAALVAECAARMLLLGVDVLVDVGSLAPQITAELEVRCTSDLVGHRRWPSDAEQPVVR